MILFSPVVGLLLALQLCTAASVAPEPLFRSRASGKTLTGPSGLSVVAPSSFVQLDATTTKKKFLMSSLFGKKEEEPRTIGGRYGDTPPLTKPTGNEAAPGFGPMPKKWEGIVSSFLNRILRDTSTTCPLSEERLQPAQ